MIGKISIGKGFAGCISYCLSNKDKTKDLPPRAEILYFNNCYGSQHQLIRQFSEVKQLNKRIEKPVWHTSFSFTETDKLTNQDKIDIANRFADKFGFSDRQYLVINHNDTPNHPHFHIIANRVGFDGKVVTDGNNFKRIAEFSREIEIDFKLTQVQSPEKFLPPKERIHKRNDSRKDMIRNIVKEAILSSHSIPEFTQKLNEFGCQTEIGRGIAFIDNKKVRVKGSEIGYSFDTIKKQLANNLQMQLTITKDRDRTINLNI